MLVARHENNIADTTNVAERREFADRRAKKKIDGTDVEGWFAEDFTFAELKTLRAKERLDVALRPESHSYDGDFQIPSLDEIVDFLAAEAATGGRPVGLIPELKHSTYFASIGLPLEERFLHALRPPRKTLSNMRVIVQSFEIGNLRRLRTLLGGDPNFQLMQLTENDETPADRAAAGDMRSWAERLKSREGLAEIAEYADWIAPYAQDLIPRGPDDRLMSSTGLIERAHEAGLLVCAWTFRPENKFLPRDFRNDAGENARNRAGALRRCGAMSEPGSTPFSPTIPRSDAKRSTAWRRRATICAALAYAALRHSAAPTRAARPEGLRKSPPSSAPSPVSAFRGEFDVKLALHGEKQADCPIGGEAQRIEIGARPDFGCRQRQPQFAVDQASDGCHHCLRPSKLNMAPE